MSNYKTNQTSFQKGQQAAKKLTTDELKAQAYEQYCAHLAKGKSKRSFVFDHPELSLLWETMEKYIEQEKDNPIFDPKKKEIAERIGFARWEEICEDHAEGKNKAVTPALQMVMRNKFGWDKEQNREHYHRGDIADLKKAIMSGNETP